MGNTETRIAVKTDEERRVVTLVGWRRRLYQVALPLGIAGGILQVLDLAGDHLGVGARVGDVAVFVAVVIPFALLGGPDDIVGRLRPAQGDGERTPQESRRAAASEGADAG
jgi:hypothetical protein